VNWFDVSPEYFDVLGVSIVKGRPFTSADGAGASAVAIVNETLARRVFGAGDAVGQRVRVTAHTSEIVGVVGDVRPFRPDQVTVPEIYWPIRQYPRFGAYLVVRAAPGTGGVEKTLRARVAAVDPGLQLSPVVSLNDRFSRALVTPRFNMVLLGAFALVAVALAAIGVFGVMAYSVASRTREIGVRIALGATPAQIVAQVVRRGLLLTVTGLALGLVGALAQGRLLEAILYGLAPTDWLTLTVSIVAFALVALSASYVPARRAARVDPLTALRQE
jgi:predicted permease